jgi:hypothetical protein
LSSRYPSSSIIKRANLYKDSIYSATLFESSGDKRFLLSSSAVVKATINSPGREHLNPPS